MIGHYRFMTFAAHIHIDQVSHRYHRNRDLVLDGISVVFEPGERTTIVGRSGCGKSTLLHIACGMTMPSDGAVFIDGNKVRSHSPKWNLMFQEPLLFPWMTVFQNASLSLRFAGRMNNAQNVVMPLLEMVGLSDEADVNVQDLSGGQQQRVALARSLASEPTALFLDEPFSALDVITRRALQRDVISISKDLGLTLVLVTHDLDEALFIGEKIVAMTPNPGVIARVLEVPDQDGPAAEAERAGQREEIMAVLGGMDDTSPCDSITQLHAEDMRNPGTAAPMDGPRKMAN